MSGFSVEPPVLRTFAATTGSRAESMSALRQFMDEIRVGRDAFGHIPMLGSAVYDAYDQHVSACEEAVSAAAEALTAVSDGVTSVADIYEEGDRQMGDDLAAFTEALDGIAFGGGR